MNQRKYALELLTDAGVLACKFAVTPIDNLVQLSSAKSETCIFHKYSCL